MAATARSCALPSSACGAWARVKKATRDQGPQGIGLLLAGEGTDRAEEITWRGRRVKACPGTGGSTTSTENRPLRRRRQMVNYLRPVEDFCRSDAVGLYLVQTVMQTK